MDELDIEYGEEIEIVPYDPAWPERYDRERSRIAERLDPTIVERIEHVGSTAVPDLPAKPIVDVLVVVPDREAAWDCADALESIGYDFFEERIEREWWLQMGRWPEDGQRFNLSIRPVETEGWRQNLRLRDYLREHDDARAEYAETKQEAVERHADDPIAYTKAKSATIESILEQARAAGYEERL